MSGLLALVLFRSPDFWDSFERDRERAAAHQVSGLLVLVLLVPRTRSRIASRRSRTSGRPTGVWQSFVDCCDARRRACPSSIDHGIDLGLVFDRVWVGGDGVTQVCRCYLVTRSSRCVRHWVVCLPTGILPHGERSFSLLLFYGFWFRTVNGKRENSAPFAPLVLRERTGANVRQEAGGPARGFVRIVSGLALGPCFALT